MLAGTKSHPSCGDSRDIFPPAGVIRLVVQPGAGHFTYTFQNTILQFLSKNSLQSYAQSLINFRNLCVIAEQYEHLNLQK